MTIDIETNDAMPERRLRQAYYRFTRSEIALKSALLYLYPDCCEVDVRRRLSDLNDVVPPEQTTSANPSDCPIAAVVYAKISHLVLAIAVVRDELNAQELDSVRTYCADRKILLFPVERLECYSSEILERVIECEETGIPKEQMPHLLLQVRCPNCGGPLVHKIKLPTSRRNGLFYACAQHYAMSSGPVICGSGFLCGADEIFEHFDPNYRDLKYRLRNDVEQAIREAEWT